MQPLTAQGIVEAYGLGKKAPPSQRGLAILSVALPESSPQELVELSLGRRDALLLGLRSKSFGKHLRSYVKCDHCSATLQFELDAEEILSEAGNTTRSLSDSLAHDGYAVRFRPPNDRDLALAAGLESVPAGRDLLLTRCVFEATRHGEPIRSTELPDEIVAAISESIEELDPLVEVPIELECSLCDAATEAVLDIGVFLWAEVAAAAQKLMYEVYVLARGYGWSEAEILAMGAARREYYLEMVNR